MERRKINSLGKIALGGLAFLVFYWIVVFLYGTSVPASSGLAGAFAIGYFAIFMAVALPAIVLFVLFLIFLGKAVSPKQAVNKQSSQTPSDKKDGGDASALKMLLFISLFPLLFLILMGLISELASFDQWRSGNMERKPTGENSYILPGNPSVIRKY